MAERKAEIRKPTTRAGWAQVAYGGVGLVCAALAGFAGWRTLQHGQPLWASVHAPLIFVFAVGSLGFLGLARTGRWARLWQRRAG